jgi:hypothetical protein
VAVDVTHLRVKSILTAKPRILWMWVGNLARIEIKCAVVARGRFEIRVLVCCVEIWVEVEAVVILLRIVLRKTITESLKKPS